MGLLYRAFLHGITFTALCFPPLAFGQTNDPFVTSGHQAYLFDLHNIDEAWSISSGSPSNWIAVYSVAGVRGDHEDLASRTTVVPGTAGYVNRPELGWGTEALGVAAAVTNNGKGIAGIDRMAMARSYSLLTSQCSSGEEENGECVRFDVSGNASGDLLAYRLHAPAERLAQGRADGARIHLIAYSLPSGLYNDFIGGDGVSSLPLDNAPPPNGLPCTANPNDPICQGGVPPPIPAPPTTPESIQNSVFTQIGTLFSSIFGSTYSPPLPLRAFQSEAALAVAEDGGVVVAPMGDIGPFYNGINYAPASSDQYAIAVGGIQWDPFNRVVSAWDRTVQRPYVDVAAIAKNVSTTSGQSATAYQPGFGGTLAAASITAGVASLLKARNPALSGEDIEQVLERTAVDVGDSGFDSATGHGYVDAGRAMRYVRDNAFVRRTATSLTSVVIEDADPRTVDLQGLGHETPQGRQFYSATGRLKRYRGRVNFDFSPTSVPTVWVRWAGSQGIDPTITTGVTGFVNVNEPLKMDLRVVSVDLEGFVVEGYVWYAEYFTIYTNPIETGYVPERPQNLDISYTAVGAHGSMFPPLAVSINGPSTYTPGVEDGWAAVTSGGSPGYSYYWDFQYLCPPPPPPPPCTGTICTSSSGGGIVVEPLVEPMNMGPQCGVWEDAGSTGIGLTRSFASNTYAVALRVRVTDQAGATRVAGYRLTPSSGARVAGGAEAEAASAASAAGMAEAPLPDALTVEAVYPNPLSDAAEATLAVPAPAEVTLTLHDALGRTVWTHRAGRLERGRYRARLDGSALAPGVYVLRVVADGAATTRRLTVVR